MIEATLTLAALIPLAGFAGWRAGRISSDAEMAAELNETLEQLAADRVLRNHYRKRLEEIKAEHPTAEDYRNRAERAEAALAEALAELAKYKLPRNAKGQFVGRAK